MKVEEEGGGGATQLAPVPCGCHAGAMRVLHLPRSGMMRATRFPFKLLLVRAGGKAMTFGNTGNHVAAELNRQAMAAIAAGQVQPAIDLLTEAIRLEPRWAMPYHNRATAFMETNRSDWALADYNKALALEPRYASAYTGRGVVFSQLKQHPQALADHNAALQLDPSMANAWCNRGTVYADMGRWGEARSDFVQAVRLGPNDDRSHFWCGEAAFRLGDHAGAVRHYSDAIRLNPNVAAYHRGRGRSHLELGDFEQTVADVNRALQLGPPTALSYSLRGTAMLSLGDASQSVADLSEAIRLGDEWAGNYEFRGRAFHKLGRHLDALNDFTRAIQREPDNVRLHRQRIEASRAIGRPDLAEKDLKAADRLMYTRINEVAARGGQRLRAALIQANRELYVPSLDTDRYCLVVLTFDLRFVQDPTPLIDVGYRLYDLKDTEQSDPELRYAAELTTNEEAVPYRRRRIPPRLTGGTVMYAADLWIYRRFLPGPCLDGENSRLLPVIAEPGEQGKIELLPPPRPQEAPGVPPAAPRAVPPPLPKRPG